MKRILFILVTLAFVIFSCAKTPAETPPDDIQQEQTDSTDISEPAPPSPPAPAAEPVTHPEGCIENDIVYAYMLCGPYEKFGEKSYFSSDAVVKATAEAHHWKGDDPAGIDISWDGDAAAEYTVSISTPEGLWYEESVTGTDYTFINLIPGVEYSYAVTGSGGQIKSGNFTPTGQVRMVDIPCTWNYRDHGGWTGLQGKKIKYGWLYRGGCLCGEFIGTDGTDDPYYEEFYAVPDSMKTAIKRIGIKAELDLRDYVKQQGQWGDEHSAHGISLSKTRFEDVDFKQIMTDWGLMYPMDRSSLVQDMAWIIYEVRKGCPVAYHCRSGADRTGALGFLINGVLGVSEGDIARDYEFTSISTEKKEKKLKLASDISSSYGFLLRSKGIFKVEGETIQEKCYYYLNKQFDDVHINADDIDWFIMFMLGLDSYEHPSWAENYSDNPLEKVFNATEGSASDAKP